MSVFREVKAYPITKKNFCCDWCGKPITKHVPYIRRFEHVKAELYSIALHFECEDALIALSEEDRHDWLSTDKADRPKHPKRLNCPGCQVININGVNCHEAGCPDAWKDEWRECKWCGQKFKPEDRQQKCCCEECADAYNGG